MSTPSNATETQVLVISGRKIAHWTMDGAKGHLLMANRFLLRSFG